MVLSIALTTCYCQEQYQYSVSHLQTSRFNFLVMIFLVTFQRRLYSSLANYNQSSKISCKSVTYSYVFFMFTFLVHNFFRIVPDPLAKRPYSNWNGLNSIQPLRNFSIHSVELLWLVLTKPL